MAASVSPSQTGVHASASFWLVSEAAERVSLSALMR